VHAARAVSCGMSRRAACPCAAERRPGSVGAPSGVSTGACAAPSGAPAGGDTPICAPQSKPPSALGRQAPARPGTFALAFPLFSRPTPDGPARRARRGDAGAVPKSGSAQPATSSGPALGCSGALPACAGDASAPPHALLAQPAMSSNAALTLEAARTLGGDAAAGRLAAPARSECTMLTRRAGGCGGPPGARPRERPGDAPRAPWTAAYGSGPPACQGAPRGSRSPTGAAAGL